MTDEVHESVMFLHTVVNKAVEFLVTYSFQVVGALLILFLGLKASKWTAGVLLAFCERKRIDPTLSRFAAAAVRGLIFGFAVLVALGKFGITIAPLVAALSAVAFGSSFAIQGPLSNLGSGLSLLMARPFVVGNTITVAGVSGVVDHVKLTATTLITEDGERITVPNRHIIGEVLRNSQGFRVVEATVGVSYGDDPERAIAVISAAVRQTAGVTESPAPLVGLDTFGDSAILIGLRYWVPTQRYHQVLYAVNLAVWRALKANAITVPFPQREVRIVGAPPGTVVAAGSARSDLPAS
ncbi:MAG: mechanosensitive ion channel family protein [Candidatus Omnitrophica bacterium]|nr:mechanosensitive ion channel family protein [Candidatus Omnitrophota bacterium]